MEVGHSDETALLIVELDEGHVFLGVAEDGDCLDPAELLEELAEGVGLAEFSFY